METTVNGKLTVKINIHKNIQIFLHMYLLINPIPTLVLFSEFDRFICIVVLIRITEYSIKIIVGYLRFKFNNFHKGATVRSYIFMDNYHCRSCSVVSLLSFSLNLLLLQTQLKFLHTATNCRWYCCWVIGSPDSFPSEWNAKQQGAVGVSFVCNATSGTDSPRCSVAGVS